MIRIIMLFTLPVVFLSCTGNRDYKGGKAPGTGDSAFQKLSDEFIDGELAQIPENGVYLGLHQYDGKLTDYRKASLDSELFRLKSFDQVLSGIDSSMLSEKMYYDYRILRAGVRNSIFNFEDMGIYSKNPTTYAGAIDLSVYVKRNFAPLEERLRSIIKIENLTPSLYQAARQNLADSLAKPFIETAILVAEGTVTFLRKDLILALRELNNDSLMAEFRASNKLAIQQVKAFAEYLRKEKLPKAIHRFALGEEKYRKMLLCQEGITISPREILAFGLKQLKTEQANFNAAAKIINPNLKPEDVYKKAELEHPTADSLIPYAGRTLESIRQFILDKKIVSIPSEIRAIVKETLPFERSTSTASLDYPGPFEKKATEAYYYITPVDPGWTAKQKEDWLAQFNYYSTDITSIHEVYPGHFVQALHLNTSHATRIEKIYENYAFSEGWAHYCEKMMVDEGYGNNGDPLKAVKFRLAQSGDALLRLCRLCVSIKMHCENMSVDEATHFLMDHWHQGEKPCRQEAIRGTFDPGYLYYAIGKMEILKLLQDYQKQEGEQFSLEKFHNTLLDNGVPPVRLLREIMLHDKKEWDKIL